MLTLNTLLCTIRRCQLCKEKLPYAPKPILRADARARLLIVGQAPGIRVHRSGIPWNDPSGNRLREWLAIDRKIFYDQEKIAIIPIGYCYPGTGPNGDYPPHSICSKTWRKPLLEKLPHIRLTLLIGQYAQKIYLGQRRKSNLTKTVAAYREYLPKYLPLPHPSPRNNIWLNKHPWFQKEVLAVLRLYFSKIIQSDTLNT